MPISRSDPDYLGNLASLSVSLSSKPHGESRYQYATEHTSSCRSNNPYGDKNEFTDSASKKAGIKMGMAMKSGWAHTGDNPYNILRVWVGNAVDIKHFEERISTEHFTDL